MEHGCAHKWEETIISEPTETKDGLKKRVCKLCGKETTVTIISHVCNYSRAAHWDEYRLFETTQKVQDWCTYYYSCVTCGKAGTSTFIYHDGITGDGAACDHCGAWLGHNSQI